MKIELNSNHPTGNNYNRYNYKRINRKNFIKTLNKAIMKKVPNIKNFKIQEINEYL